MKLFLRQWQVAFRKKPQGTILSDIHTPFIAIPNTMRFVAADPFLFNFNGKKYLFAELLDKKENLGKIGYAEYNGHDFGEWKVIISEPWHLSYPNIFEYNGNIYIVPEAGESETLYAYKAVDFPSKWEKCPPILTNFDCVDTTFLSYSGQNLMFTYGTAPGGNKKLYIYSVAEDGKAELFVQDAVSDDVSSARHGGNFFRYNGDIIRVSQDCLGDYGKALVFSKLLKCSPDGYEEEVVKRITPSDVIINKKNVTGIHTYNADDEIEVIDFHVPDYSLYTQYGRILNKLR